MTDVSRLNPHSNPIANLFDEVRENILGRSSSAKLRQFETQLARDPAVVDIANRVEPDAFVLLLERNTPKTRAFENNVFLAWMQQLRHGDRQRAGNVSEGTRF